MRTDFKTCAKGFTHGGVFHADDVFATALLKILNPDIEIIRGYQVPEDFDGIVYDVGMGKYDHHQKDRRVRENGVPYAAFGLLWEECGTLILSEEDAVKFDEHFVQPLDWSDNTGESYILAKVIGDFNASWRAEQKDADVLFGQAVDFAKTILENRFEQILAEREAENTVLAKMEAGKAPILVLDQSLPWKTAVIGSEYVYVIYPSLRGGYNVQAVPQEDDTQMLVRPFPEAWRGKTPEALQELTGITGFTFCHVSGFLCAADTIEDAVKVAELALSDDA